MKNEELSFDEMRRDAKAYGLAHGYKGELGGWIYSQRTQSYVCQGWIKFYRKIGRKNIERWKQEQASS